MENLNILMSKCFKDEELFLEELQEILNYEIVEYAYRDVFDILDNIYYRVRVRLENDFLVEFVYYFTDNGGICILHIEY